MPSIFLRGSLLDVPLSSVSRHTMRYFSCIDTRLKIATGYRNKLPRYFKRYNNCRSSLPGTLVLSGETGVNGNKADPFCMDSVTKCRAFRMRNSVDMMMIKQYDHFDDPQVIRRKKENT